MSFILASESPRRRELLKHLMTDFQVVPAAVEEWKTADPIRDLPLLNAKKKADYVSSQFPDSWVLGADTIVLFENRIIGKPKDLQDAEMILTALSGHTHEVITGLSLCRRALNRQYAWSESTTVVFRNFPVETAREYIRLVPVLDKAGAYAIQDHGEMLVDHYDGELENIIGLPLKVLSLRLRDIITAGV